MPRPVTVDPNADEDRGLATTMEEIGHTNRWPKYHQLVK